MAEHLKLAKPSLPDAPDFVRTSTANNILLSVDMIRAQPRPAMTMVCGVPGCGKSTTLEMLAKSDPDARLVSIAPGEGGAFGVAEIIVDKFGLGIRPKGSTIATLRREIGTFLQHAGIWLMVDEAQHLTKEGADWLRILCEESRTDLLLAGDLRLARMIDEMPQLQSRMLRAVIVEEVTEGDVRDLAQAFGVQRKASFTMLHRAALVKGGLRTVNTALLITRTGSDAEGFDEELLPAALMEMGLISGEGATK